ncbi:MAG TPA: barstar family protein [Allosphingosinicella sp.]|jgi:ribonuclease inhibitor
MGSELLLDGRSMASEADLHDVIDRAAREVGFGGYGRNLDALWDVLTGFLELPVQVRWVNARFNHAWGLRYDKIVRIFEDAERELGTEFKFEIMP